MKLRLATLMTWNLPVASNRPDMGTYPVNGDCPVWQRKMREVHGDPATVERTRVGSRTGRLRCFEPECTGIH